MPRVGAGAFLVRMVLGTAALLLVLLGVLTVASIVWAHSTCDPGVVDEATARGPFTKPKKNRCNSDVPLRAFIEEVSTKVGLLTSTNAWTNTNDFGAATVELPNATSCDPGLCDDATEAGRVCVDKDAATGQQLFICEGLAGWVLQSGRIFYNVQSYGALGDGANDDTAEIQAAIAAAAGNGIVYLPCGTYKITAPLELDYTNTHWMGEGDCTTIRQFTTGEDGIIQNAAITDTIYNVLLQDFRLDCDASATSCGVGFNLESVSDSEFRNIYVDVYPSGTAGFTTGVHIHSTSDEATRNLFYGIGVRTFAGAGSIGIALTGTAGFGANSTRFYGGHVRADSGTGISIPGSVGQRTDQCVISGLIFEGSTTQGISIGGDGSSSLGHVIEGCRFEGVTNGILLTSDAVGNLVMGNLFSSGMATKVTDNGTRNVVLEPTTAGGTGTGSKLEMSRGDVILNDGSFIGRNGNQAFQARSSGACTTGNWFVKGNGLMGWGDCAGSEEILFARSATGAVQLQLGSFMANGNFYTGATASTPRIKDGSGSPEGVVSAVVGSLFQSDASGGTSPFYVKAGGAGTTGWVAVPLPGSATPTLLPSQPAGTTATIWLVSGHSKNQLYAINQRSDVTITGNTGTVAIASATAPFSGEEDAQSTITITTAATDTAILEASVSPRNTTCVGVANPDACCSGSGVGTCNLPTHHLSLTAGWYVSAQFYGTTRAYPQTITVEGQYDDGAGATTWRTLVTTTTNASTFYAADAATPSMIAPHKIYALRWTFTNWNTTGTTYLLTVGLHHKSERAFPPYLARDGDADMPMLGPIRWGRYLGAITHLQGPPDQPFALAPATGQSMTLGGIVTAAGATSTAACKVGTTAPATCTVGDCFFDSDATAGQNLFGCTATNTWTLEGGSGSGDITDVWGCPTGNCDALTAASGDTLNAGSADSTAACKVGTTVPATCTVGDCFFDSDATAGQNLYGCTATNTWTLQGDGGGSAYTCAYSVFIPTGSGSPPPGNLSNVVVSSTLGQLRCIRVTAACHKTATKIAYRVGVGVAGSQTAAAVFSLDGNTKILDSGPVDSTSAGDKSVTGLSGSLVAHTDYWGCVAGSQTATLAYWGLTTTSTGLWDSFQKYQVTAANIAQFNDACTANLTPYACCTGADTGTCTGIPSTLGTLTTSSFNIPVLVVSD